LERVCAGVVDRAGTVAATEVRLDSTLGSGLDRDFDGAFEFLDGADRPAFTFKLRDLARTTGPLAAFFVALGFAFALLAIALPNL